ncbi:MAG: hypothetical protein ABI193_02030 [Minicystis sp.]
MARSSFVKLVSTLALALAAGAALSLTGCQGEAPREDVAEEGSALGAACVERKMGFADSCKSPDSWKEYASTACASAGLDFAGLELSDDCGGGDFRSASYQCCGVAALAPAELSCAASALGDGTSCEETGTLKEAASKACAEKGLDLTSYALAEPCGKDSFFVVEFECCPPAVEPTPELSCVTRIQGGPDACESADAWKETALKRCAALDLKLATLDFHDKCGDESYQSIKFECCP